jgi:hypothetical protein
MNNVVDDDVPMPKVSNMRRAPSTVQNFESESMPMMSSEEFQDKPRARSFKTLADADE